MAQPRLRPTGADRRFLRFVTAPASSSLCRGVSPVSPGADVAGGQPNYSVQKGTSVPSQSCEHSNGSNVFWHRQLYTCARPLLRPLVYVRARVRVCACVCVRVSVCECARLR